MFINKAIWFTLNTYLHGTSPHNVHNKRKRGHRKLVATYLIYLVGQKNFSLVLLKPEVKGVLQSLEIII